MSNGPGFIGKARAGLAKLLSPDAFKRAETQARRAHITPSDYNRAVAAAWHFYEAIQRTTDRAPLPYYVGDSKDTQHSWTRLEMLSIARNLYVNDGLTGGAIDEVARYTVGTGIRPHSQADTAWADRAEDYWESWCDRADLPGQHHLDHLQLLWNVGEVRDGDIGIVLTDDGAGDPRVQTIRGHRIGNFGKDAAGLLDGVRLNDYDSPLSYRISTKDGGWREIPARSFILYYEPTETDASRGISKLHRAINHARDKKDTLGYEKKAIKGLSSWRAVLKSKPGTADPAQWEDDSIEAHEPTRLTYEQIEGGGAIPVIQPDESLEAFDFNRPSPAFVGFLEFLIREIAFGLGIPYEFLWNPEKIGGAPMRFVMEKAQRRFTERQLNFVRRVLRRIWGYVIGNAIVRGRLPDNPEAFRVKWQLPAKLSVDAGRNSSEDREDVKYGLMSEAEHYGMRGEDYRVNRDQIEREVDDLLERAQRVSKKRGVSLEMALSLLKQSTPNDSPSNANTAGKSGKKQEKETEK